MERASDLDSGGAACKPIPDCQGRTTKEEHLSRTRPATGAAVALGIKVSHLLWPGRHVPYPSLMLRTAGSSQSDSGRPFSLAQAVGIGGGQESRPGSLPTRGSMGMSYRLTLLVLGKERRPASVARVGRPRAGWPGFLFG